MDGKEDGLSTMWHENGQKKFEINFKNGKKDGFLISWYENGQKKMEGNIKNEKKDGFWTYWDKEGNVTKTETYKDGEMRKLFTTDRT